MMSPTLGDLSGYLTARRQNVTLRQQILQHSQEMTTGRAQNATRHLKGDLGHLAGLEHDITVATAHSSTIAEASVRVTTKQAALGAMFDALSSVAGALLSANADFNAEMRQAASDRATLALDEIVTGLNVQVAGHSLFAGSATDRIAVLSGSEILSDLRALLVGQSTLSNVDSILDDWFDSPTGGYMTTQYFGNDLDPPPLQLGPEATVEENLGGHDARFRNILKSVVKVALSADPMIAVNAPLGKAMAQSALDDVLSGQDQVTAMRATLGVVEERVEKASAHLSARVTGFETARLALVGVDTFEAASQLEALQFSLESLYTVTARLSRLSLLEHLR